MKQFLRNWIIIAAIIAGAVGLVFGFNAIIQVSKVAAAILLWFVASLAFSYVIYLAKR